MGIQISELVPRKTIKIEELRGKTLAVDAANTLYQFLSVIRQADGTPLSDSDGTITSHLSGVFYRSMKLLENGVKLIYVFDGEKPEIKKETLSQRKKIKQEAYNKWQDAKNRGDLTEARKYAQASLYLTPEMIQETKELLTAMAIPWVDAPMEGEAQAAYLVRNGDAFAVSSSDYDTLLFGGPKVIRNISITGKRKVPGKNYYMEIQPELIKLDEVLETLKINQEQLITLGILIGTDYNPGGIKGIGPKTALKIVKEHKTFEKVMENIEWTFEVPSKIIFDFFNKPVIAKTYSIKTGEIGKEKIKEILCEKHEFLGERINNAFEKIEKGKQQMSLNRFMKR